MVGKGGVALGNVRGEQREEAKGDPPTTREMGVTLFLTRVISWRFVLSVADSGDAMLRKGAGTYDVCAARSIWGKPKEGCVTLVRGIR